jgi:hypothetical protein
MQPADIIDNKFGEVAVLRGDVTAWFQVVFYGSKMYLISGPGDGGSPGIRTGFPVENLKHS